MIFRHFLCSFIPHRALLGAMIGLMGAIGSGCKQRGVTTERSDATQPSPARAPLSLEQIEAEAHHIVKITKDTVALDSSGQSCELKKNTTFKIDGFMEEGFGDHVEFQAKLPFSSCTLGNYFILATDSFHLSVEHPFIQLSPEEKILYERKHFPELSKPLQDLITGVVDGQWHFPLNPCPIAEYSGEGGNGREFGASREGGRRHAAVDLLINDTRAQVLAIKNGEILDYYVFYQGTYAVVVEHGKNENIVRYGEVAWEDSVANAAAAHHPLLGGRRIAKVGTLYSGASMLHFELYSGSQSGNLSTSQLPYRRRSDLLNPTALIKSLESQDCS